MRQSGSNRTNCWAGWALVCLLSLTVAVPARGDDPAGLPGFDEKAALFQEIPVVTGASRYEQKVSEAPSFVTIITAEDIKLYGYRTLSDILRSVGGFYISYDRNYASPGVRGFGPPGDLNTRLLVLVDGMRLNESIFSAGATGTEFVLDINLIDRVEIIRGPGSSLYGTNALLGVVNVISRSGRNLKGTEVSAATGSYDTIDGRISYGDRFTNGLEVLLSGTYYQSAGNNLYYKKYDRPGASDGVSRDCDDDRADRLFTKVAYHDLTFEALYSDREKGIPTGAYDTKFNDSRSRTWDEYALFGIKYDHTFANQLNAVVHAYFYRYNYNGDYYLNHAASPRDPPLYALEKDYGYMERLTTEGQLSYTLFDKHKLIVGAEINYNLHADQGVGIVGEPAYMEDQRSPYNGALYVQDEFHILSDLILNAGVRYDYYDTFGGTVNPRLALIYNPWPSTALKALYGTAFRAPNAYELEYHDAVQKGNPDLKPEHMDTFELIWEQELGAGIRLTTAGYYYNIRRLITLQTDPGGVLMYGNLDEAKALGCDVELNRQWANGISGRVSYSFAQTENTQTGRVLSNSPEHMVKANMAFPLITNKLFLSLETQYMSNRTTNTNKEVGGVVVANITLFARNLFKNAELSATIYNLLDEHYGDPSPDNVSLRSIPQDGRSFRLKLTYSF